MSAQIFNFALTDNQAWAKWAECAKYGAPGMFPSDQDHDGIRWARNTCLACPVMAECLAEALGRNEQYGVWGGLTTDERNTLRRRNHRTAQKTGEDPLTPEELAMWVVDEFNRVDVEVAS